jgi:hypothetical protein
MQLAGHGKDPQLVQPDLLQPIIEGDENYTPDYFLSPCKQFLGAIDLDPFSCELANKTIGAANIFTREDDALTQDWTNFNRKWVNPPYSSGLIGKAIAKTLEYCHIGETLLLVNTSSSAKWFQACMEKCSAYMHPSRRINFDSPFRTSKGNRYDQALFYFGDRPLEFAEALSFLGNAVQPIKKPCLPTSTVSEALEPFPLPPETLGKSSQSRTSTSAKTLKKSMNHILKKSQSIPISEATIPLEVSISSQADFLAPTQVLQETKKDLMEMSLNSGLSTCDASKKDSQDLLLSKILQDYSIAEWEQSSKAYPKAGICVNGKLSPLPCLEAPKREKGCSSLPIPTLTTGLGSGRNAGATRLEKWLKDNQFLQSTQALSVEMMSVLFGFPMDWALCLLESQKESKAETMLEPCSDAQSMSIVPPSQLSESSICIEFSLNNIDASNDSLLDQPLESLIAWRDRLIKSGASPEGVWLSCSQVRGREFYQVQWRSNSQHPWLGDQKSKYVGVVDSKEHLSAIAIHQAGQQLVKIEKQIKKLQEK